MAGCLSPPTTAVGMHNLTRPGSADGQLQSEPSDRYGSAHDPAATEFAAPKLPLGLRYSEAVPRHRVRPTQC
jgi:hypothetical protein